MAFHVGQLVVCVNDQQIELNRIWESPLRKGRVYSVRRFLFDTMWEGDGVPCVLLNEVARPIEDGREAPFLASRFRPITESRLAIFRQHLVPRHARGRVEA